MIPLPDPDAGLGPRAHWATYSSEAVIAYAERVMAAVLEDAARLCERYGANSYSSEIRDNLNNCAAGIRAMSKRPQDVQSDSEDAERYRYLREQDWNTSVLCCVTFPAKSVKLGCECPSRDRLDTLVDLLRKMGP